MKSAFHELNTDRFHLKKPTSDDLNFLCTLYADEDVMRYISTGVRDKQKSIESLEKFIHHWNKHAFGMWIVHDKQLNEKIGYMGFRILKDKEGVEFGGLLLKKAWGKGAATEIGKACLAHGLEDLGFTYIYSVVDPNNEASLRWIPKLGLKRTPEKDGIFHDTFMHYFCITNYT